MGNKCCSKRQDQELALSYPTGYKKSDYTFNQAAHLINSGQKHNNIGSLDSRYTPDPNRGPIKAGTKGGVDIIRPRTTPSEYYIILKDQSRHKLLQNLYLLCSLVIFGHINYKD